MRRALTRRLPFSSSFRGGRLRGLPPRIAGWLADCLRTDLDQGRGFLWLPVAAACGVALYFALPREPHWPTVACLGLLLAVLAARARRYPAGFGALVLTAALALGVAAAASQTARVAAPVLSFEGTFSVRGFVESREPRPDGAIRYVVRVVAMSRLEPDETPRRVRFTARGRGWRATVGDGVTATARLAPPHGPVEPGGYDGARSLFFQGIGATGFSYGLPKPADLGTPPLAIRVRAAIGGVRDTIADRLRLALPGENGELAATLLVGDRGGIPEATRDALRASGLGHILAISGLHMALVAGTVFFLLRFCLAAVPQVALRYPIKKWAAAAALVAGLVYLVLSGGAVATVRAFVMLAVALVAELADRPAVTLRSVAVAALVILALDPSAVMSPGFQMSFAAVIALVAAYEVLAERERSHDGAPPGGRGRRIFRLVAIWIGGLALTSLIAGLATGPIGAFHFHRVAPLGLLGNLLAMPLVTFVVMPAGVVSVVAMPLGLDPLPLAVMGAGLDGVGTVARFVADLSGTAGAVGRSPASAVILMAAGLLWLSIWTAGWRLLGVLPLVAGLVLMPFGARPDLLVSDDGRAVAVRGEDGRLQIATVSGGTFAAAMWLEADGDPRVPEDESVRAGVLCDALGCTLPISRTHAAMSPGDGGSAASPGQALAPARVAFVERPQAFLDDCRLAAIVVTRHAAPWTCSGPRLEQIRDKRKPTFRLDLRQNEDLERFQVKWNPVHRPETRQNKDLEHSRDSTKGGHALVIDRDTLRKTGALALTWTDKPPFYRIRRARPTVPRPWTATPVIRR